MTIAFRPLKWLTAATLIALAVLIALGVWQLERREWKLALIASAEERMNEAPVLLDEALRDGAENAEFRHVRVSGAFLRGRNLFEYSPGANGPGYRLIAPFRQADGTVLLVDRGFVPPPHEPWLGWAGAAPVEVTGWVRLGEKRNWFTPDDDLEGRVFYARDPQAMARLAGVVIAQPIVIVAERSSSGFPQGGMELSFSNPHLGYALTWFGLAGVLIVIYLVLHRSRGRL